MTHEDICFAGVDALGSAYRAGTLSPVDVVRAHLERIHRFNDVLHSYVTVTDDDAFRHARDCERELRNGIDRGPLHGVPYAIKDQVTTKGVRTTAGSRLLSEWVPQTDATVVTRMRDAGAILLGKLNMCEFALGGSFQFPFGTPRNPWNLDHETGGSSNGAGSALAAGLATVTLGEDTGGSVRSPAAHCGVVGLRPTWGAVSRYGLVPAVWSMDTLGPMGRTVRDVAYALQAVAGHDPFDPTARPAGAGAYRSALARGIRGLKVGVIRDLMEDPALAPDVAAAVRRAIAVLGTLGASVGHASLPLAKHAGAAYVAFGEPEAASLHATRLRSDSAAYGHVARVRLATGLLVPGFAVRWAERVARRAITEDVFRALEPYDVLVAPTSRTTAPRLEAKQNLGYTSKDDVRAEFGLGRAYTTPFAFAGVPALAVCCGFSGAGLPVSLQIVGKRGADDVVLRAGHAYQEATEWHTRRPVLA